MMQEIQEIGQDEFGPGNGVSHEGFAVLLALARKPMSESELRNTLGLSPPKFRQLLNRLHKGSLVRPGRREEGLLDTLCLTEDGESALLNEMEQMCELPEK